MYTNETRHKYTEPVHSTQEQTAGIPEIYIIELVSNFPVTDRRIELKHYVSLIEIENAERSAFYERQAVLHFWSVRELERQIKKVSYMSRYTC